MQGIHEIMSLVTFQKITGPECTPMKMTIAIIDLVEKRAFREGMDMQIIVFDRNQNKAILNPNDLLAGVDGKDSDSDDTSDSDYVSNVNEDFESSDSDEDSNDNDDDKLVDSMNSVPSLMDVNYDDTSSDDSSYDPKDDSADEEEDFWIDDIAS